MEGRDLDRTILIHRLLECHVRPDRDGMSRQEFVRERRMKTVHKTLFSTLSVKFRGYMQVINGAVFQQLQTMDVGGRNVMRNERQRSELNRYHEWMQESTDITVSTSCPHRQNRSQAAGREI